MRQKQAFTAFISGYYGTRIGHEIVLPRLLRGCGTKAALIVVDLNREVIKTMRAGRLGKSGAGKRSAGRLSSGK